MPLVNSSTFYSFLSNKLESNFKNSTSKVKGRFVRTFKNDLISYIFQNFVTRSDVALTRFNETFSSVLGEFKNKPNEFGLSLLKNLYKEMIALQENKPELASQYTILNNLFIVSEKQFKNIALSYFNKDSQLQDSYIEQFKELLNHKDLEVRNFMLKFAYMSFFQSGLNKSFISSADIIPAHVFAPILDAAREQYFKEVNTPQKQVNILKDAFDKFLENNDRFRDKEDNRGKSDFNILGVKSDKGKWYESNIDEVLGTEQQSEVNTVEQNVKSFQGYKGGFEDKGKGTQEGDGKDKAMRQVADGFVVELSKNTPSSSLTSLKTGTILEQKGTKEQTSARSTKNLADEGSIIMLARNGSLSGKPLSQITKDMINYYHNDFNMEFVIGDMPNVDSQFIDYLQEIGAKFTIYHTGNTPRIQVKQSETKDTQITKKETKTACEGGLNI